MVKSIHKTKDCISIEMTKMNDCKQIFSHIFITTPHTAYLVKCLESFIHKENFWPYNIKSSFLPD